MPSRLPPTPDVPQTPTPVELPNHLLEWETELLSPAEWYEPGISVPILEERPFPPEVEDTTELADTTQAAYQSHLETEAWTEAAIEEMASTDELTQGVSQQWADIGVYLEHGDQEQVESDIDTERVAEEFFQQQGEDEQDANHHGSWENWFNIEWEQDAE